MLLFSRREDIGVLEAKKKHSRWKIEEKHSSHKRGVMTHRHEKYEDVNRLYRSVIGYLYTPYHSGVRIHQNVTRWQCSRRVIMEGKRVRGQKSSVGIHVVDFTKLCWCVERKLRLSMQKQHRKRKSDVCMPGLVKYLVPKLPSHNHC